MSLIPVRVIRSAGAFVHEVNRFWEQMFGLLLAVLFSGVGVIAFVLRADGVVRRFLAGLPAAEGFGGFAPGAGRIVTSYMPGEAFGVFPQFVPFLIRKSI
jgi:hypothetical protein